MTKVNSSQVDFNRAFDIAISANSVEWLKTALNITPKPHNFEKIIVNKLKKNFSFKVADYLFKNDVIKNLPNKLYQGFDNVTRTNSYELNLLAWVFSNENISIKYLSKLKRESLNTQSNSADFSTEILEKVYSSLNLDLLSKEFDLYPYIFEQLSKNKAFKELIRESSDNNKYIHSKVMINFFYLALTYINSHFPKNNEKSFKENTNKVLSFFSTLFISNQHDNALSGELFNYIKERVSYKNYDRYITLLHPYLKCKGIEKVYNLLVKDYIQRDNLVKPFVDSTTIVSSFGLNNDFWKNNRTSVLHVEKKTKLSESGGIALMFYSYSEKMEKRLKDYLVMTNQEKEFYFKEILELRYPLLLHALSKGEKYNKLAKELIDMGIDWIEKHGNYSITYFSKTDNEIKTSLMDILVRGVFINSHSNNMKVILKSKKILDFIIENNVLDDFRDYSSRGDSVKSLKTKISLTEEAIKAHILNSLVSPVEGVNPLPKKLKFKL